MVGLDIDMPKNCDACDFLALFGDGPCGCVLVADDENEYGLKLIENINERPKWCILKEL